MSEELLPCPFCGSDSFAFVEGSTFKWHKIECNTCGASCGEVRRKGDDMVELTKEWNTRPDSKLEKLDKYLNYYDLGAKECFCDAHCCCGADEINLLREIVSEQQKALNIRPDSKTDCKSFCKLFSEAKLRDDFYLEKCRLCKESPDSKPYKWANEYEWMNAHLTMYKGDNASDCMLSAFNAGRERKEK